MTTASPRTSWIVSALVVLLYCICNVGTAQAYMLKKTKTGEQVRWSSAVVTMYVDEKLDELFGSAKVRSALAMATDAWRGLPGVPDLAIASTKAGAYDTDQRHNGIYLVSPWPYEHQQLAVTVSTYDETGEILGVDVLINAEHQFAILEEGTDTVGTKEHDLSAVLTHELGHVLGLGESPTDRKATMWPYISAGEVHQRSIAKDDEDGVIAAYAGSKSPAAAGCGQASVVGAVRGHSSFPLAGLLALVVVVAARRRAVWLQV